MNGLMRNVGLVLAGAVLGSLATARTIAQQPAAGHRVNHVGVSVTNMDETVRFYTNMLGFREAYRLNDDKGSPTMVAIQVSKETFLELAPANANRPAGLSHIGIEADDIQATVSALRKAGLQAPDPRFAANTGVTLANLTDPNGIRVEFLQLNPDSLQRKAINSWK